MNGIDVGPRDILEMKDDTNIFPLSRSRVISNLSETDEISYVFGPEEDGRIATVRAGSQITLEKRK